MYELIRNPDAIHIARRPAGIEYRCVYDTIRETGDHHFLHGVAVEQWRGRLAVCFAFNDHLENSITEKLIVRWSEDKGRTWSAPEPIAQSGAYANSHSVFLPQEEALWCFGPRFFGLGEPPVTQKGFKGIRFTGLQTEAWRYDGCCWKSMGIVADGFWPLSAPVRLENGCWLLAGCDTDWMAAAAVSRGDDLLHWDVVRPETNGDLFTEAGAWADGSRILLVMRNNSAETDGRYHAAVARSDDFGRTFAPAELSSLPMCTTKPFCGRLGDGRPFLLFNESIGSRPHDRSRLLLGIGEIGSFQIDRIYLIDEGQPTDGNRRLMLSYPYARHIGDKLYIGYSSESAPGIGANNNDAMLAVVDVNSLG